TRPKKYSELIEAQQLQDDCDVQATNIILHGLPPDVFALVHHQEAAKDIWDRGKTLYEYYWRFSQLINDIHTIGMTIYPDPLSFIANSPTLYNPSQSPQHLGSLMYPPPQQFTPVYAAPIYHQHHHTPVNPQHHPVSSPPFISPLVTQQSQAEFLQLDFSLAVPIFQPRNAAWFKEKLMLAEAQETDDLDAYDSDCDDLSSAKAVILKFSLRKLKGKNVFNTTVSKPNATIALGMFKLDIEPISPRLKNNRDAHEELLVYVSQTCPNSPKPSEKLVVVTPMNKAKKVRFAKLVTSLSNIPKKTDSLKTKDSNKHLLTSTGVKPTTSASGSKPSGNTKNNRITRPPSSNQKNKVEYHSRKVKSSLNKTNSISKPISNALVKYSVRNAKIESICAICNKCLFVANHDMCLMDFVNDVNVCSKSKSKRNKMRKVWKPTCKVFTDVGYKWEPTERFFTIVGNSSPLTKITPKKIVHLKETTSKSIETPKAEIKVYSRRPKQIKSVACALGKSKKSSHQPKAKDTNQEKLYLLHMDLCGPMRVKSINRKKYILAEAINTACYTQNRSLICLRYNKTPYKLMHDKKSDFSFFHVFGSLWCPTNDSEDLDDWDSLFQPLFDEYFNPPTIVVSPILVVAAPRAVDIADSLVSTSIDQDPPLSTIPSTQEQEHSLIISQGVEESPKTPLFHDDPLHEFLHEDSTSQGSSSNVRTSHNPFKLIGRWSKDHLIENVIGDPSRSVSTKSNSKLTPCGFTLMPS
ncbi:hypothetical protein Tco_0260258, partial [Tanacetum coccineum]